MTHNDQFEIMLEKHIHYSSELGLYSHAHIPDIDVTGTVSKDILMHQGKTSWVSHR